MEDLIKITEQNGNQVVNARELYQFLESKQDFSTWMKNRIEKYGFVENTDFEVFHNFMENPNGGRPLTEYALSISTAKELAMVEGNEKGKQARRYFIACEEKLKQVVASPVFNNTLDMTLRLQEHAYRNLNMNDNSKLLLMHKTAEVFGIDKRTLPQYTDSRGCLLSATELLKRRSVDYSIHTFNSHMMDKKLLETKQRPSRQGTKCFKALSELGLKYGENQVSPNNANEVQPKYYEGMFDELLTNIGL